MKLFIIITLAVFGLAYGTPIHTQNLDDDIQEFLDLIPTDKIVAIALDYYMNDKEVQQAVEYLKSDEFKNMVITLNQRPEFINFIKFLKDCGLRPDDLLEIIYVWLGISYAHQSGKRGNGISGLIDDTVAALPQQQIKDLYADKMNTSPEFAAMINKIKSPEFQKVKEALKSTPEYQKMDQKLKEKNVDLKELIEMLKQMFGISY